MPGPDRDAGPSGIGKGTHGRMLAQYFGVSYLSTGALLRQQVQAKTRLGAMAAPILANGCYLPDDVMCAIIAEWLPDHPHGWVLDGFPRSKVQADFLDASLASSDLEPVIAVCLTVPLSELLRRMESRVECRTCGWGGLLSDSDHPACPECGHLTSRREDDEPGNLLSRYREFEKFTLPLVDAYRGESRLIEVDACGSVADVADRILVSLRQRVLLSPA